VQPESQILPMLISMMLNAELSRNEREVVRRCGMIMMRCRWKFLQGCLLSGVLVEVAPVGAPGQMQRRYSTSSTPPLRLSNLSSHEQEQY
jgi:hypothetical protein